MSWYALYVETGKEEFVRKALYRQFDASKIRCLIPKRKIPERRNGILFDVIKVIFPGYLLICLDLDFSVYHSIIEIPCIYRLLNYHYLKNTSPFNSTTVVPQHEQSQYFKEIPSEDMNRILTLINQDEVLDYSEVLMENSTFTVRNGPLKNREGLIKKIDKHKKRAKILIPFGDKEIIMDVGLEIFERRS